MPADPLPPSTPVPMVPVTSSNLAAVGYHAPTRRLVARFKDGSEHAYQNVPPAVHAGLMKAKSHGSFLHKEVLSKPKRFPHCPLKSAKPSKP